MSLEKMKVTQQFYHPGYPGEEIILPAVGSIQAHGMPSVNLCAVTGPNKKAYKSVVIAKDQYFVLLGTFGSLKMKNLQGVHGSISFYNDEWDAEYERRVELRGGRKGAENAVSASTWTELHEDIDIADADDFEPEKEKTPEELEAERLDKEYDTHIKAMTKAQTDGKLEDAKTFAKKAIAIKPQSRKAKALLDELNKDKGLL